MKIIIKTAIFLVIIILSLQIGDSFHHILLHGHGKSQTSSVHADNHCCTDLEHFIGHSDTEENNCPHCIIHLNISKLTPGINKRKDLTYNAAIPAVYSFKINNFKTRLLYNHLLYSSYQRLKQNISHTLLLI